MIRLFQTDAIDYLRRLEAAHSYNVIFADPPDNLGMDYRSYHDKRDDYYQWLKLLIFGALAHCDVFWLSYYWKHDLEIKRMVWEILKRWKPSWEAKTFIWRYTFGQYNDKDCGSGYRPILRLNRPGIKWAVNGIRVESERMKIGDSRASGPKVPDDVWEFPRIVGNCKERRPWISNQHPEALIERIFKLSMFKGEETKFLDLFTGSGTGIRVAKKLGLDLDAVDLRIEELTKEHNDSIDVIAPTVLKTEKAVRFIDLPVNAEFRRLGRYTTVFTKKTENEYHELHSSVIHFIDPDERVVTT